MAISAAYLALTFASSARADDESVWAALKSGGHVALIRHALAPGFGDPENFSLDDPKTQRNLSAEGRAQAKRIGAAFTKSPKSRTATTPIGTIDEDPLVQKKN